MYTVIAMAGLQLANLVVADSTMLQPPSRYAPSAQNVPLTQSAVVPKSAPAKPEQKVVVSTEQIKTPQRIEVRPLLAVPAVVAAPVAAQAELPVVASQKKSAPPITGADELAAAEALKAMPIGDMIRQLEAGVKPQLGGPRPETAGQPRIIHSSPQTQANKAVLVSPVQLSSTGQAAVATATPWQTARNPTSKGQDGRTVYNYGEGLPELICAPLKVCVVELQPGERIIGVPQMGDSVRWQVSPMAMGEGANVTEMLVIKPTEVGLDTNIIVATTKRLYYLRLVSQASAYTSRIAFAYPDDVKAAWVKAQAEQQARVDSLESTKIEPVSNQIEAVNLDYTVAGDPEFSAAKKRL